MCTWKLSCVYAPYVFPMLVNSPSRSAGLDSTVTEKRPLWPWGGTNGASRWMSALLLMEGLHDLHPNHQWTWNSGAHPQVHTTFSSFMMPILHAEASRSYQHCSWVTTTHQHFYCFGQMIRKLKKGNSVGDSRSTRPNLFFKTWTGFMQSSKRSSLLGLVVIFLENPDAVRLCFLVIPNSAWEIWITEPVCRHTGHLFVESVWWCPTSQKSQKNVYKYPQPPQIWDYLRASMDIGEEDGNTNVDTSSAHLNINWYLTSVCRR